VIANFDAIRYFCEEKSRITADQEYILKVFLVFLHKKLQIASIRNYSDRYRYGIECILQGQFLQIIIITA
jgi:hypothetical protein